MQDSGEVIFGEKVNTTQPAAAPGLAHRRPFPFVDFRMAVGERKAGRPIVMGGGRIGDIDGGIGRKSPRVVDTVWVFIHIDPALSRAGNKQVAGLGGPPVDGEVVRAAGISPGAFGPCIAFANIDIA